MSDSISESEVLFSRQPEDRWPSDTDFVTSYCKKIHEIALSTAGFYIPVKHRAVVFADDVAQETSLYATKWIDADSEITSISRGLVTQCVRHRTRDLVRKMNAKKRAPETGFAKLSEQSSMYLLNQIQGDAETPSKAMMRREQCAKLNEVYIDPADALLFELFLDCELPWSEIAKLMDEDEKLLRARMSRRIAKLRADVKDDPLFSSPVT